MPCYLALIGAGELQGLHENFGVKSVLRLKSLRKILVNELRNDVGKSLILGEA
jgi:hypothetical protein